MEYYRKTNIRGWAVGKGCAIGKYSSDDTMKYVLILSISVIIVS